MGLASLRSDVAARKERKFEKKVRFYTKVKESLTANKTIDKKNKLKRRQKKLKAYDLSTLSEFLPDVNKTKQAAASLADLKLNSRTRKKIVLKEGSQLKAVLNHPVFQANPLGSIHQHLASTQPEAEKPEKKSSKDSKKKKKVKKSKKGNPQPQAMEI